MEPIFITSLLLVGTVAGCFVGVLLAQFFNRKPAAEAAALRLQLQSSEGALASATANLEALRKQTAERDLAQRKNQEALDAAARDAVKEGWVPGSDPARELRIRAEALIAFCGMIEAQHKESAERATEEAGRQKAALEQQIEAERRRAAELSEQLGHAAELTGNNQALQDQLTVANARLEALGAELVQQKQAVEAAQADRARFDAVCARMEEQRAEAEAQRNAIEAQLNGERERSRGLAEQIEKIKAESGSALGERESLEGALAAEKNHVKELSERLAGQKAELDAATADAAALETELASERSHSDDLKAQLGAKMVEAADFRQATQQHLEKRSEFEQLLKSERERNEELLKQVTDLRTEIVQLEGKLEEERRTAATGMKLLTAAQDNLARVFKALAMDVPPAANGHSAAEPAAAAAAPAVGSKNGDEKPVLA